MTKEYARLYDEEVMHWGQVAIHRNSTNMENDTTTVLPDLVYLFVIDELQFDAHKVLNEGSSDVTNSM